MMNTKAYKILLLAAAFLLMIVCLSFARTDHRDFKNSKPEECQDCHSASDVSANHGAFFVKEHRLLAQRGGNNCQECHQQSFCLDCHKGGAIDTDLTRSLSRRGETMPRSHRSDFISIHSLKAADNPQNCYRCHETRFCNDCHAKTKQGTLRIKSHRKVGNSQIYDWNSDHAAEARRNLQSCESCHPEADVCIKCHSTGKVSPHPRTWKNIQKRYRDTNNARTCKKCHITF